MAEAILKAFKKWRSIMHQPKSGDHHDRKAVFSIHDATEKHKNKCSQT